MYEIEISLVALNFLNRLQKGNKDVVERIKRAIDSLKSSPFKGKKLLGEFEDFRSLRVGQYRLIYTIIEERVLIQIVKIAHRREVYR